MSLTCPHRVADLSQTAPNEFALRPGAEALAEIADELGLKALRKLSFNGTIETQGRRDWVLTGDLGATVVQPCVVTLQPVSTRVETRVRRLYVHGMVMPDAPESEMPEDETQEPLGTEIDPCSVMIEALALAVPLYPRAEGAELGEAVFTEPGQSAMTDEDARPFAGLAELRDKLANKD